MKQYTIRACPFCGCPPLVFGSGEGRRGMVIECATEGCVNPHVSYYNRDQAARVWNNRLNELDAEYVSDAEITANAPL